MPDPEHKAMRPESKYAQAFKESFNTVGMATAIALSAATLNPLPLLAGIVLETAYLLVVPDSKWYENRLSTRYDEEIQRRRQKLKDQIYPELRPSMKERFDRLEATRRQMNDESQEGKKWFREVLRKMDYLLEKFLLFAQKENQFRDYLRSVMNEVMQERDSRVAPPPSIKSRSGNSPPSRFPNEPPLDPADDWVQAIVGQVQSFYDAECKSVDDALARDPDDLHTNAVLEKRIDVLHRRHDYVSQIGKILVNLNHQLQLMEDTFGLINDEIRARSPEQVLADIDDVVWKADALAELLEEVSPANAMPAH